MKRIHYALLARCMPLRSSRSRRPHQALSRVHRVLQRIDHQGRIQQSDEGHARDPLDDEGGRARLQGVRNAAWKTDRRWPGDIICDLIFPLRPDESAGQRQARRRL